jgi:hypothetical protein
MMSFSTALLATSTPNEVVNGVAPALAAAGDPAGGAALDQVAIATGGAALALGALFWSIAGYRVGKARRFERVVAFSERVSGLPGWAAIPTAASGIALEIALLGMY